MRKWSMLSAIVVLALLLCSTASFIEAAVSESSSSTINIDQALGDAGLPADATIIKYHNIETVTLSQPIIVVKGTGLDTVEAQVLSALSNKYQMNASYLIDDKDRTFNGRNIENYDIIVVGGPLHNAFTNELTNTGVLKVKNVYVNGTGLVIESERMATGHTVLVVASIAGYIYKEPPGTTTVPNEPGGGGAGGNGFEMPTPTMAIISPTPLPENLHVTAQATLNPGNNGNTGLTTTPGDDLLNDMVHEEYHDQPTDVQWQGQVTEQNTGHVLVDILNNYLEQTQSLNNIDQIQMDSVILNDMSNVIQAEGNAAHSVILNSQ